MRDFIGRILCFFGVHDFELVDATYGFGHQGGISKHRCRRCGEQTTKVT